MNPVLAIDLPAMLVAIAASIACALPGSFLVLRGQALLGDALSHMVLPGIVVAFLATGRIAGGPMLIGALVAGLVGAGMIALVRRAARLEANAAMGLVFTVLFAVGVVLLETDAARKVDLDLDHALYGHLEAALWLEPSVWSDLLDPAIWLTAPRQLLMLVPVAALLALALVLGFKELRIASFDPDYAALQGFRPRLIDLALTTATTLAAVAAFEAVGSILVIALLTCPAAVARLCTGRLVTHVALSIAFASIIAVVGYGSAAVMETSGSATMAAAGGLAVAVTVMIRRLALRARPPAAPPGTDPDSAVRPIRPESA